MAYAFGFHPCACGCGRLASRNAKETAACHLRHVLAQMTDADRQHRARRASAAAVLARTAAAQQPTQPRSASSRHL